MEQLTLSQTIAQVESLINTGAGDPGRLFHILEFLKKVDLFLILINFILRENFNLNSLLRRENKNLKKRIHCCLKFKN